MANKDAMTISLIILMAATISDRDILHPHA